MQLLVPIAISTAKHTMLKRSNWSLSKRSSKNSPQKMVLGLKDTLAVYIGCSKTNSLQQHQFNY